MSLASFSKFSSALLSIALLSACANWGSQKQSAPVAVVEKPAPVAHSDMPPVVLPSRVTAIGYGAMPTQEGLSNEQRRLLAIRASKLDAYRALAETVAGLKITGNSTVSAVTITNDSFRVYVEAYLRGAKVMTITPMPGGSYETVLELVLGGEFYRDLSHAIQAQPQVVAAPAPAAPKPMAEKPMPSPVPAPVQAAPEAAAPAQPAAPAMASEHAASEPASANFYLAK